MRLLVLIIVSKNMNLLLLQNNIDSFNDHHVCDSTNPYKWWNVCNIDVVIVMKAWSLTIILVLSFLSFKQWYLCWIDSYLSFGVLFSSKSFLSLYLMVLHKNYAIFIDLWWILLSINHFQFINVFPNFM